jgi:hypothetical protein
MLKDRFHDWTLSQSRVQRGAALSPPRIGLRVSAIESTTWSIYESLPRNPCSQSPLPPTGDLRRAQTDRKIAPALSRPGASAEEQVCPIHTGIREPRFNATLGVQLLDQLVLSRQPRQPADCYRIRCWADPRRDGAPEPNPFGPRLCSDYGALSRI